MTRRSRRALSLWGLKAMCEDYEDYCYECGRPFTIREQIWQIIKWKFHPLVMRIRRAVCRYRGHIFHDREPLSVQVEGRTIIIQDCSRCYTKRYIYEDTREIFTPTGNLFGMMVYHLVNKQANIFSLLPKKPWDEV